MVWFHMRVRLSTVPKGQEEERELPEGSTAADAVRAMGLPTVACIVLRSGEPIPIDEPLEEGDDLEVVYVASGG
jgi:sulfur carrier protein ThiS